MLLLLISQMHVQTVVEDEKDRAFIRIRGPLVNILVAIAPDVYGPAYVTVGKKGEKQLLIQCLTALYGTMVASLLYYKKFVKSLKLRFRLLFRICGDEWFDAIDIDIDFLFVQLNSDIAVVSDFCDHIRSCPFWCQFFVFWS